jgi:hypothetical protein
MDNDCCLDGRKRRDMFDVSVWNHRFYVCMGWAMMLCIVVFVWRFSECDAQGRMRS